MSKKNYIFNKNFAERLAVLFNKETQSSISKRLDCSQGLLSNYLKGEIPDTVSLLSKLANEYSVDLHLLITGEELNLKRALETVIESTNDDYYRKHADKFTEAHNITAQLESKQTLTSQETKTLEQSRCQVSILQDRLTMLLNLKLLTTTQLKALLENLNKG